MERDRMRREGVGREEREVRHEMGIEHSRKGEG